MSAQRRTHPVKLSIAHKFCAYRGAQFNIGQTRQSRQLTILLGDVPRFVSSVAIPLLPGGGSLERAR